MWVLYPSQIGIQKYWFLFREKPESPAKTLGADNE